VNLVDLDELDDGAPAFVRHAAGPVQYEDQVDLRRLTVSVVEPLHQMTSLVHLAHSLVQRLYTAFQTTLRRSSSDHSVDAVRSRNSAGAGSCRSIPAARTRAAANQLRVAAAYWLSIDRTDGQTGGRTDNRPLRRRLPHTMRPSSRDATMMMMIVKKEDTKLRKTHCSITGIGLEFSQFSYLLTKPRKKVIVSCTCALGQRTANRRGKCTKQPRSCL